METSFVFPIFQSENVSLAKRFSGAFVSPLRGYPTHAIENRGLARWATTTAIRMSPLRGYSSSLGIVSPFLRFSRMRELDL